MNFQQEHFQNKKVAGPLRNNFPIAEDKKCLVKLYEETYTYVSSVYTFQIKHTFLETNNLILCNYLVSCFKKILL